MYVTYFAMSLYLIIIYVSLGLIWLYISEIKLGSNHGWKLFKLIVFLVIWPLFLFVRIERAYHIGKYLKPHSKWHLIVKNKVVRKNK